MSHDKRTMLMHFQTFLASGRHCPGVFIIDDAVSIGDAIEILLLVWRASEPEEWIDRYERLD